MYVLLLFYFFFFNDTATTEIYTLSLHDALPIFLVGQPVEVKVGVRSAIEEILQKSESAQRVLDEASEDFRIQLVRSEEHTSELQSRQYLVCRLLLEKKKKKKDNTTIYMIHYTVN